MMGKIKIPDINQLEYAFKDTEYKCPICKDTGVIQVKNGQYEIYKICDCQKELRNRLNMRRANLSEKFENKNFKNFRCITKGHEVLRRCCIEFTKQDATKGLAILGNVGVGKTHLAVATLKELAKQGLIVNAVNYATLSRELSSAAMDKEEYARLMGKYTDVQVLLIDDLFKGKVTDANIRQMYELINSRYENNKRTIFTSEYTEDKLMQIDEAIGSRIIEMADHKYCLNITKLKNWRLRIDETAIYN